MIKTKHCLTIFTIAVGLAAGNVFAADARSQLIDMAEKMAKAKQFSVSMQMRYDVVQGPGQKIEFSEVRKVLVDRPNNLRVEAEQSDGDVSRLFFDGKVLTIFNRDENVYSQTKLDGDLDAGIRHAVGKLGMRVPLARMLTTTFPQELESLSSNVSLVEHNTLGDVPTDQIVGRTDDIDYQVWIAEDNLPRRIVLTYKNAQGQPQFRAEFSDWNLSPEVMDTTFTFIPPKGAEMIPTLIPASKTVDMVNKEGGA